MTDEPDAPTQKPEERGEPRCAVAIEEAKALWDRMEAEGLKPTCRKVAAVFAHEGRHVDPKTVWSWQKKGWKHKGHGGTWRPPYAKRLEQAIGNFTGDMGVGVEDLVPEGDGLGGGAEGRARRRATRIRLSKVADDQLMRESSRMAHITAIMLLEEIQRQSTKLVAEKPRELGALVSACAEVVANANASYEAVMALRERAMKLIEPPSKQAGAAARRDGVVMSAPEEPDPMILELKAFKNARQR